MAFKAVIPPLCFGVRDLECEQSGSLVAMTDSLEGLAPLLVVAAMLDNGRRRVLDLLLASDLDLLDLVRVVSKAVVVLACSLDGDEVLL